MEIILNRAGMACSPANGPQTPSDGPPDNPSVSKEMENSETAGSPAKNTDKRRTRRRPRRRKKRKAVVPQTVESRPALESTWDISDFVVDPAEGKTRFHDYSLPVPLMHAVSDLGFQYCTPIQSEILPSTLAGRDACGRAQTGTGKTAAFLISVITRLLANPIDEPRPHGAPRTLVLAPTRELVLQIAAEARQLTKYCHLNVVSTFGGMNLERQRKQLTGQPVDILVATPGRLLDFQRRGDLSLKKVEILIIDEADRMLDMGFIPDVRKIINSTPSKDRRQTMLFSATLTAEIARLSSQWTRNAVVVEVEPEQITAKSVEQIIYIITSDQKFALLYNIIQCKGLERVLVFCNRRDEVRRLAHRLTCHGINCEVLSGEVPQKKRIQRLDDFKAGRIRVLVATDVAGRGIHIEGMDHVINFTLPRDPEDYVHRIGRTGRAGAAGTSISFADEEDSFYLPAIAEYSEQELHCTEPEEAWLSLPEAALAEAQKRAGASLPAEDAKNSGRRRRPKRIRPQRTRRRK